MSIRDYLDIAPMMITLIKGMKMIADNFDASGDRNKEIAEALNELGDTLKALAANMA